MKISLIITTYNWPQSLDLVLASVARQRRPPDEVIVTDDGSGEETAHVVAAWAARFDCALHHIWQKNEGFRAARARNRAIAAARGDYLILIDGDMVLDEHFVADHERASEPGCFVQGVRIPTHASGAAAMFRRGSVEFGPFTCGLRRRHLALRNLWLSRCFSPSAVVMSRVKSCNQGYWRNDLIKINGFEERMVGWGSEDKECVIRLIRAGVRGKELRFAALALHLHHVLRTPAGTNPNDALFEATLASNRIHSVLGVSEYLSEFDSGIPASARPPWRRTLAFGA